MTPGQFSHRHEFTPVPCHGSVFVYMIPLQNVMPARVTLAWVHPGCCTGARIYPSTTQHYHVTAEMPTSGDLKSGDCLFFTSPSEFQGPPSPPKNWPSPQWEWLRTLYDVLHDVHTIKIRMLEIIFVNDKNAPETVLRIRKLQVLS